MFTWRTVVLAVGLVGTGFLAGVLAAPRLRGPDAAARSGGGIDAERASAGPEARERGSRQQVETTKLLMAASQLARAAQQTSSAPEDRREARAAVTLEAAPAPVREALLKLASGRPMKDLHIQHRQEPVPRFEAEFELDGVEHEMNYDPQGKLLESEIEIAPSEIPANVQQSVAKAFPGAVMLETERLEGVRFPSTTYEIDVRAGGSRRELWVNEAGEIVRERQR